MLEPPLGSADGERILLFITERGEGYGRQIADFWGCSVTGIQRRLDRMESGGVLQVKGVGRTRVYTSPPIPDRLLGSSRETSTTLQQTRRRS